MAQKKEGPESSENKPGVKIQDLTPSKDAKGGVARNTNAGGANPNSGINVNSARNNPDGAINVDSGKNLD
jgi:hypothetical protein